jgi:hypothetical protein
VKATRNLSVPQPRSAAGTVCCDLAGFASLRVTADQLPALRQRPGPPYGAPFPASFLKHADEQTVGGLNAVLRAIHDHGLGATAFTDWAIVAAPRFLGRSAMAVALHRFKLEGAWGISPHLIPHNSLHSLSGTVSQALKVHGPNFGVSGAPHAADEGLLTAAALLAGRGVPGVWLILTGHDPEFLPEPPSAPNPSENGRSHVAVPLGVLALALVPARPGSGRLKLYIGSGPIPEEAAPGGEEGGGPSAGFSLEALTAALAGPKPAAAWWLHCGGWVELKGHGAGAEN